MDNLFSLFLILHITTGSIGLITGTAVIIAEKGKNLHKFLGKVFYLSMLSAGFSALALSVIKSNNFLLILGVFTIYLVWGGNSYLYYSKHKLNGPRKVDLALFFLMLISIIIFIVLGILLAKKGNTFSIVYFFFSFISIRFLQKDYYFFKDKNRNYNKSISMHLQRMMGGYIASTTAFLAVNVKYIPFEIPEFIWWILPTLVFTPFIIKWSKKYSSK